MDPKFYVSVFVLFKRLSAVVCERGLVVRLLRSHISFLFFRNYIIWFGWVTKRYRIDTDDRETTTNRERSNTKQQGQVVRLVKTTSLPSQLKALTVPFHYKRKQARPLKGRSSGKRSAKKLNNLLRITSARSDWVVITGPKGRNWWLNLLEGCFDLIGCLNKQNALIIGWK